MSEAKKPNGLWGKLKTALGAKSSEKPEEDDDKGLYSPQKSEPVDLLFVKKFTASGGKFLYCEKESDAYDFIADISRESAVRRLYCDDPSLRSILSKAGFRDLATHVEQADAFCSTCEYLVSFNGGIMITARQTKGKKLSELPETFITFARTSQIVPNLRAALTGIRTKYQSEIPSQITTIKGPLEGKDTDETDSKLCKKEIYLLLLEDQV